jgi:hypothetical protein
MNCRDFERLINEQLDARGASSPELERALASHGAACPACRATSLRYQALRQAIADWGPPPSAPADFADRFLSHWESSRSQVEAVAPARILKFWPVVLPLAAAAGLLVAVGLGVRSGRPGPAPTSTAERPGPASPPVARSIDPAALSDALAEATAATWDLARETSNPAARVGLEVLDAAELAETTVSLSVAEEGGPAVEVFQGMGERVNERVSPLSGTARHAFSFLLGPVAEPAEAEVPPPAELGVSG